MKFACPQCATRYAIGNDKLPDAKILRFTCKKCGTVIRLRRKGERAEIEPSDGPLPSSLAATGTPTRVASLSEIRKLRAKSGEEQSTRIASIAEIKRLAAGTESRVEWLVLVGGKQKGPLDRDTVAEMIERKEIDRRTYVWRTGMADWQRLGFVDVFKALAEKAGDAAAPSPFAPTRTATEPVGYFAPAEAHDASYFEKPPGESTRVFMATAGLFRRRRTHRIAAVSGLVVCLALVTVASLDLLGYVELPGMARVYEMTGVVDPNAQRAMRRVEARLQDRALTAEERASLEDMRHRLVGNLRAPEKTTPSAAGAAKASRAAVSTEGVADTKSLTDKERDMTAQIFADERKQESKVRLATADEIQAPNLPSGLTVEAIFKVISDNSRSMNLCLTEAMRKGEKLSGKMEIELTILPDGSVSAVSVNPAPFKSSVMGQCTARRIKGWRFPRFNGEAVQVSYPYLLQMGF